MPNVKNIEISATLPFDWPNRLPGSEAALFARLLLPPACGLSTHQEEAGYVLNDHGGQTPMYNVVISGAEALSYPLLDRVEAALSSVGRVHSFIVYET